ncbi:MAG: F0F1 ATP synthase subunit delta [Atopobiaceae bacterium]|jgi:F-type H+-transporting ATPase subunit delta|nr:F0F1 ATP synthase subunit delta [Atopobiaceae bacterium]MCH4180390.1 F0F1 ATP synthase subunit delta [Atopobiaceae bacterium]MCH4214518.1 F0F1 ATP synthase subunit delta [Atopobiaceae bacterium]MCH4229237.1 F0F1 ATP synthase subunit delta [Atopobiaceae bacterium]MCH4276292.1 F0F1 ATP synthase subunit delta [Atopobiaceae bacterium]
MSISRTEQKRVETYAHTLLEAAKSEDREVVEARDLESLLALNPEALGMIKVMGERDELDLLPEVVGLYQKLSVSNEQETKAVTPQRGPASATQKSQSASKASTYARTLLEAAKTEGREGKELEDLQSVEKLTPEIRSMLAVMASRQDSDLLPRAISAYKEMLDKEGDTVAVEVTTAVPLDDELREKVRAKLGKSIGKGVFLIEKVDPDIIGGIIVSAHGHRRDASVRAQLNHAREVLTLNQIGGDSSDGED